MYKMINLTKLKLTVQKMKHSLRAYYQEKRKKSEQKLSMSSWHHQQVILKVLDLVKIIVTPGAIIGIYYPLQGEISLLSLINLLPYYKFALPTFINEKIVYNYYYVNCPLVKSKYGIYAPLCTDVVQPDLLLVPGIVFAVNGYRIGFGTGSYDQYITDEKNIANNLKSVGVCFNFQLRNFVIKELHDQKMDYIVTEQMLIRCSDRTNYNNVKI